MRLCIVPVGLYVWRVLKGIKTFRPDKVYLVKAREHEETPEWSEKIGKNTELVKQQLGYTYKDNIEELLVNFEDFKDVFLTVHILIDKETSKRKDDPPQFFIDITSTPLLTRMALVNIAAIHRNVGIYYTPSETKLPTHYQLDIVEQDKGKDSILIPVIRSQTFDELRESHLSRNILTQLAKQPEKKVQSLADLLKLLGKDKNQKNYMLVGRLLSSLHDAGLITMRSYDKREKEVRLTFVGEALAEAIPSH